MEDDEEQMITSSIMIDIPTYTKKPVNSDLKVFYEVNVYDNYSHKKWTLLKRYSNFYTLYQELIILISDVPILPGKTILKVTDEEDIKQRRIQLESFLSECVKRKDILSTECFIKFLEVDKFSPNINFNSPNIINTLEHLPFGVRDFFYFQEENILFIGCSEMNIVYRVNSYISNYKPWNKNQIKTVGIIMTYQINLKSNKIDEQFIKKWEQNFGEQIGSINFNIEKNLLMIGLDTGRLITYKTGVESHYSTYVEALNIKPHTKRIMGLDYDEAKNVVYSCSSDKKFIMSYLNGSNQNILIDTNIAGYTNLKFDKKNKRIFLTNEIGQLLIFITGEDIPVCVNTINTHTKNTIRGLNAQPKSDYLFTATIKGDISVMDLDTPGREKYIEETSYFGGNIPIRVIMFNDENNELITGDQKGKITIWSLKIGKTIFAWKGHERAITQMFYDSGKKLLITGGKDKKIIFWKLPENWENEEFKQFEKEEIKNLNDTIAMLKLQKALEKNSDSDDTDSLDGWDLDKK